METREPGARHMDATQPPLTHHFGMLATAPGGVARLRDLIVSLAVQGRLVQQHELDEPAEALLDRIRNEKQRLVSEGRARSIKPVARVNDVEQWFAAPESWAWVRLNDLVIASEAGWSPSCIESPRQDGQWGVLKVSAVSWGVFDPTANKALPAGLDARPEYEVKDGDFLLSRANTAELVARSVVVASPPPKLMLSDKIIRLDLTTLVNRAFVNLFNNSSAARSYYAAKASGTSSSMKNVSRDVVLGLPLALPPAAEQARIVARVDELMHLCDALEAKGRLEAEQHARLLSTMLGTLTDSTTPEELAANWQRFADHFDLLLDRPEAVDAIEHSIVQLAVRGLLLPQDPTDEPADSLLLRVCEERRKRVGVRNQRGDDAHTENIVDQVPFAAKPGWRWARLGNLVLASEAGWSPTCHATPARPGKWGVLKVSAVSWGEFDPTANKQLPDDLEPRIGYEVKDGDFLLSRANTVDLVARSAVVRGPPPKLLLSDKIIRLDISPFVSRDFVSLSNNSDHSRAYFAANASGTSSSMKNVSREVVLASPIAVPPRKEQERIVARVTELRRLCADLRQRLTAAKTTQSRLADALVDGATA